MILYKVVSYVFEGEFNSETIHGYFASLDKAKEIKIKYEVYNKTLLSMLPEETEDEFEKNKDNNSIIYVHNLNIIAGDIAGTEIEEIEIDKELTHMME